MRICVYGAGAVGGALAVRLAEAGEDVSVVARGVHGEAIRERGLTLVAGETSRTVSVPCVDDPDHLPAQDVVFVTVKQTHLPAIAQPLSRLIGRGARTVFAMNGIPWWFADELPIPRRDAFVDGLDPGGVLRAAIDTSRVIGAVVVSSNEVVEPGVILSTTPTRNFMVLGNVVTHSANRIDEVLAVLQRAGYGATETADIRKELWNKMVLWLAVSPIAALTGLPLDRLVSDPGGYAAMAAVMREALAIGRRLGFDLPDEVDARIGFYRDKPTRVSLLKDFELGREPELASGVLVFDMLAKALDVPAPHIATVATLARLKFAGLRRGVSRLDGGRWTKLSRNCNGRKMSMDARRESEVAPMKNRTTVERKSERELVVTRSFNGPARLVFEAWTKPELFRQWWVPKSMGMSLLSCEMDVRVGGSYRLEFAHGDSQSAFFGTYKEVTPHSRLVWTNEESDEGSVTTVTFAEKGGKTLLVMHELYPSKEALDTAGTGAADAMGETFEQLDELLVTLGASVGRS